MKNTLLLLVSLLLVSSVLGLSEVEYQDAFISWTKEYNKVYRSSEFNHRYSVFKFNLDYVNEWNSKNSESVLGTTQFADLTKEEYRAAMLGK